MYNHTLNNVMCDLVVNDNHNMAGLWCFIPKILGIVSGRSRQKNDYIVINTFLEHAQRFF